MFQEFVNLVYAFMDICYAFRFSLLFHFICSLLYLDANKILLSLPHSKQVYVMTVGIVT